MWDRLFCGDCDGLVGYVAPGIVSDEDRDLIRCVTCFNG